MELFVMLLFFLFVKGVDNEGIVVILWDNLYIGKLRKLQDEYQKV